MKWFIYILKCADDSLYTGITTNPKRREYEHNSNKVRRAKSLSGRLPVRLIYTEMYNNQKEAAKREKEIKGWRREKKLNLVKINSY